MIASMNTPALKSTEPSAPIAPAPVQTLAVPAEPSPSPLARRPRRHGRRGHRVRAGRAGAHGRGGRRPSAHLSGARLGGLGPSLGGQRHRRGPGRGRRGRPRGRGRQLAGSALGSARPRHPRFRRIVFDGRQDRLHVHRLDASLLRPHLALHPHWASSVGRRHHLGAPHVPEVHRVRAPPAAGGHRRHPHHRRQRGRERSHDHGPELPHRLRAHRLRGRGAVAPSAHRPVLRRQRVHGRDAAPAARARGPHPHHRHPRQPAFSRTYDRAKAREAFGLPQDKQVVLALAGAKLPQPYVHFRAAIGEMLPFMHAMPRCSW